jgi:hypothetical protein
MISYHKNMTDILFHNSSKGPNISCTGTGIYYRYAYHKGKILFFMQRNEKKIFSNRKKMKKNDYFEWRISAENEEAFFMCSYC